MKPFSLPGRASLALGVVMAFSGGVQAQPVAGMIDPPHAADSVQVSPLPTASLPVGDWRPAHFRLISGGGPWVAPADQSATGDTARLLALLGSQQWTQAQAHLKATMPDVNVPDLHGQTALSLAAQAGQLALVQALIKRGADLDRPGVSGWTPLMAAILRGHPLVAEALLKAEASPVAPSAAGQLPLHAAAAMGEVRLMGLIAARGGDPWAFNREGRHALAEAAYFGQVEAMRWLARSERDWQTLDQHRLNAVHAAALGQQREALAELQSHGVAVPSMLTQVLIQQMQMPR